MDTSIFLAQAFGLFFLISGVALLIRPRSINELIDQFSNDSGAVMMGGYLALVVGIPLVLVHNIWDGAPWQTLITVMAWLAFLKGVTRVLMPEKIVSLSRTFGRNQNLVKLLLIIMVIIGVYLMKVGFGF